MDFEFIDWEGFQNLILSNSFRIINPNFYMKEPGGNIAKPYMLVSLLERRYVIPQSWGDWFYEANGIDKT